MPTMLAVVCALIVSSPAQSVSVRHPVALDRAEATVTLALPAESKGFSLVLAPERPNLEDAAEPNVEGAFGVGFDVHNPKETNPFNANGNIYGRPEREVSLHFDGVEIENRLSPVEIRTDRPQPFRVRLESALGGSLVSVWVGRTAVYDRHFVPFLKPNDNGWHLIGADGKVRTSTGRRARDERSTKVEVFSGELNDASRHRFDRVANLPADVGRYGRVVGVLTLAPTPRGVDPWDRLASLTVVDEQGRRIEVVRNITPYRKGWTWTTDVTHLLPILRGNREFRWECETWGEGWLVSFDLHFFEGSLRPRPFAVIPLWQGTFEIGTGKPLPQPMTLEVPAAHRAEVFTTVTGHGMNPNTGNAAEFLPLWRRLAVNGREFENLLWKEDNYLNPCRPQGGTWKYDRAGWAPGSIVAPWRVDVTRHVRPRTTFGYTIQPYENKTPVEGNPARHVIESVLVLYR